jgi:hypothetical protein
MEKSSNPVDARRKIAANTLRFAAGRKLLITLDF